MCVPGVFTECHNSDESRAKKLLVRMSHLWGRTTCLRLALEADDKNIIAQSGVQVEENLDFPEGIASVLYITMLSRSIKVTKVKKSLNLISNFFLGAAL